MAFADFLDLQTAVIERVKDVGIADVFPQLVKLAEADFNRKLRCREQITTTTVTIASGEASLPADFQEMLGVYDSSGYEYINQPAQNVRIVQSRGYYTLDGTKIKASADETLTLQYYASVPTLTTSSTTTNWLLTRHPMLYLFAVAMQAAVYKADAELVASLSGPLEMEYRAVDAADASSRYARARVRVAGVTP